MTKKESDETKIALINNNINFIQRDIAEIKGSIKELSGVYATTVSVNETNQEIERRLTKLESQSLFWRWLIPSLAALFSSILTFLIISYLQLHK